MHIRNQLSAMQLESQSSRDRIQDTVHREVHGITQTLSMMRQNQVNFESRMEVNIRQVMCAVTTPKSTAFSVESDIRDLVAIGGFDPEITLMPPLRALRDLVPNSAINYLFGRLIIGEIDKLLASTYVLCAESAKRRADSVCDVPVFTEESIRPSGSHNTRGFSTQSRYDFRPVAMDLIQSVQSIGQNWINDRTNTGKLFLAATHRRTRRGVTQFVFLKYTPKVKPRQQGYGISLLFEVYRSIPGVDSVLRNIRPFNVQPSTADVFSHARTGNIPKIDELFKNGDASVIVHDEEGYGLLVVGWISVFLLSIIRFQHLTSTC